MLKKLIAFRWTLKSRAGVNSNRGHLDELVHELTDFAENNPPGELAAGRAIGLHLDTPAWFNNQAVFRPSGDLVVLNVIINERKVPGAVLTRRVAEEVAKRPSVPSAEELADIRATVYAELLGKAFITTKHIPVAFTPEWSLVGDTSPTTVDTITSFLVSGIGPLSFKLAFNNEVPMIGLLRAILRDGDVAPKGKRPLSIKARNATTLVSEKEVCRVSGTPVFNDEAVVAKLEAGYAVRDLQVEHGDRLICKIDKLGRLSAITMGLDVLTELENDADGSDRDVVAEFAATAIIKTAEITDLLDHLVDQLDESIPAVSPVDDDI